MAISVVPHKLAGDRASTDFQIRAGLALNALVNAAVLSLFALMPGGGLGEAGLIASLLGLSSTIGLGLNLRRQGPLGRPGATRLVLLLAVYVVQAVNAVWLLSSNSSYGCTKNDAILVVVCFLFAIDRAWELLGGSKSGLFLLAARQGARATSKGAEEE